MALRLEELAKTIDLALLKPAPRAGEVEKTCAAACEHHVAAVCVLPPAVEQTAALVHGCDVKVCAVVGFPFGAEETPAKLAAVAQAIRAGAREIEFVLNVRAMLSGDFRLVRDELAALVRAVRLQSVNAGRGAVLVKAVLETGHLDDKRIRLACKLVEGAGLDFAQTSTGADSGRATVQDVELLRELLSESVGVKAAGGIDSIEDVEAMLGAGAARTTIAGTAAVFAEARVREPV
jgi:deoxyribose-phosphate aldolase